MTPEEVITKYIAVRDKKAELSTRHAEEMRPLNEAMDTMERWLLQQLTASGLESFKCSAGTAYKSIQTSVTVADGDVFKRYAVKGAIADVVNYLDTTGNDHNIESLTTVLLSSPAMALFELRSSKKEVQERLEQGETVPGLNVTKIATVGVRRS